MCSAASLPRSVAASAARVVGALGAAMAIAFAVPVVVAAHTVNATYASRLPLAVYVVGAAVTVALSFIFVIVRDVRAAQHRRTLRRGGESARDARMGAAPG